MERAALKSGYELHNGASCYVIVSVLGKGGFGITYKAYSASSEDGHKSYFAVKEFFVEDWCERNEHTGHIASTNPTRDKFENGKRDFFSESKRLSQVSHSNIVKVYDVFEENNTIYYVMEYLEGECLDAYLKANGALAETQALALMKPIFDAVEVLHANNMTHLDIKPANIMLKKTEEGNAIAVLIDFGLAKHYDTEGNPTTTLRQSGYSDGYSPIEQYSGISTFSPQSDVYALAATLFHCLIGHRPTKSTELTEQELEEQLSANVSGNVKDAIVNAMRMSQDERTQSVEMFIDEMYDTGRTQQVEVSTEATQFVEVNKDGEKKLVPNHHSKILKIAIITIIIGVIAWLGYSYLQNRSSAQVVEKMRQDSIAKSESLAKARQDSLRQESLRRDSIVKDSIRQDSMWRYRETPDLAIFELHGPVKSVSYSQGCLPSEMCELKYITFNKEGKLTSAAPFKIIRDKSGKINSLKLFDSREPDWEMESFAFTYDSQNRVAKVVNRGYEWGGKYSLNYNNKGFVESESFTGLSEAWSSKNTTKYTYTNIDKYGNWTARSYTSILVASEEGSSPVKSSYKGSQTRKITYYER